MKARHSLVMILLLIHALLTPVFLAHAYIPPTMQSSFLTKQDGQKDMELSTSAVIEKDLNIEDAPSPPPESWIPLASDPDEGIGTNLRSVRGQLYDGVIYLQVRYYRPWVTLDDIDTGICIDADRNPSTGLPDGSYPGQNTGIGADYLILVGREGNFMYGWNPAAGYWDHENPIPLAYLEAPDNSNTFVVGVYLTDVETVGALDCSITEIDSGWDWIPDAGHFTLRMLQITIYTDKTDYSAGEMMQVGLEIVNPGNAGTACVAVWIELPAGGIVVITHVHAVTLPAGLNYSNPSFMTIILPSITSGTYIWHAAILSPTTHNLAAQNLAEWQFI